LQRSRCRVSVLQEAVSQGEEQGHIEVAHCRHRSPEILKRLDSLLWALVEQMNNAIIETRRVAEVMGLRQSTCGLRRGARIVLA
jgi:hypothetical protein